MDTRSTEELGRLIARAHYQAWRTDAPPFDLTVEELAAILPNLIRSGSAGIIWHRVKPVRERFGALAYALEAATEAQIAHNKKVEPAIVECITRLRARGIEPVLVKGLATAKLYPEGIVRPAGDIDLVVRKHEFAAAHAILNDTTLDRIPIEVDLKHPGTWEECPDDRFWCRTQKMLLCDSTVSVLAPHDNLAMNSFHFAKHGGLRPLWLSDIAMLVESIEIQKECFSDWPRRDWILLCSSLAMIHLGSTELETRKPELSERITGTLALQMFSKWLGERPMPKGVVHTAIRNPRHAKSLIMSRWPSFMEAAYFEGLAPTATPAGLIRMSYFGRSALWAARGWAIAAKSAISPADWWEV